MTNISVNRKMRTLEITKKFDKASSRYGSDEYKELQNALAENPGFKVVVKSSTSKKKETYKGLTFEYMEKYIKSHDESKLEILYELRGLDSNGKAVEMAAAATYGEIKMWFLTQFPEIEDFGKNIDSILEETRKTRSAKKRAA